MEEISQPVLGNFKIKVVIDTQILAYLVDKTYPRLNAFFEYLFKCRFTEIVCPRFAAYEFIEVRKLEHYLREIYSETNKRGGTMNFSSALKYNKKEWSSPELPYQEIHLTIKQRVEEDLDKIKQEFDIRYEGIEIHKDIWKPHQDLVLSSKLSKEDSLVLLSSVFPDQFIKEPHILFLTNDNQFYRAIRGSETERMASIDDVFSTYGLTLPCVYKLSDITLNGGQKLDLKIPEADDNLEEFATQFILEHITLKAKSNYLGFTVRCEANGAIAQNLLCFEMHDEAELKQNIYLVVISKDLSFIYTHPVALADFYSYGQIQNYPHRPIVDNPNSKRISIQLTNAEGENIEADILQKIKATGNLVFIHPDSFIG